MRNHWASETCHEVVKDAGVVATISAGDDVTIVTRVRRGGERVERRVDRTDRAAAGAVGEGHERSPLGRAATGAADVQPSGCAVVVASVNGKSITWVGAVADIGHAAAGVGVPVVLVGGTGDVEADAAAAAAPGEFAKDVAGGIELQGGAADADNIGRDGGPDDP